MCNNQLTPTSSSQMLELSNKNFKAAIRKIFSHKIHILPKKWKGRKSQQKKKKLEVTESQYSKHTLIHDF